MSCCFGRRLKRLEKRANRHRIYPEPVNVKVFDDMSIQDIGASIGKEYIECGVCCQSFTLNDGHIVGSCVGCDRFLHCGIAGKCIGVDCRYLIYDKVCRATWCLKCVSMKEEINQKNNTIDGDCICINCSKKPK